MNKLTRQDWQVICIALISAMSFVTALLVCMMPVSASQLDNAFFNHRDVIDINPKSQEKHEAEGTLNLDDVIWLDQSLTPEEVQFRYVDPEERRHVPLDSFDSEMVEEDRPDPPKKGGYQEGDKGIAMRVSPPPSGEIPPLDSEWMEWLQMIWAEPIPPIETHV